GRRPGERVRGSPGHRPAPRPPHVPGRPAGAGHGGRPPPRRERHRALAGRLRAVLPRAADRIGGSAARAPVGGGVGGRPGLPGGRHPGDRGAGRPPALGPPARRAGAPRRARGRGARPPGAAPPRPPAVLHPPGAPARRAAHQQRRLHRPLRVVPPPAADVPAGRDAAPAAAAADLRHRPGGAQRPARSGVRRRGRRLRLRGERQPAAHRGVRRGRSRPAGQPAREPRGLVLPQHPARRPGPGHGREHHRRSAGGDVRGRALRHRTAGPARPRHGGLPLDQRRPPGRDAAARRPGGQGAGGRPGAAPRHQRTDGRRRQLPRLVGGAAAGRPHPAADRRRGRGAQRARRVLRPHPPGGVRGQGGLLRPRDARGHAAPAAGDPAPPGRPAAGRRHHAVRGVAHRSRRADDPV
ncbi:MAG: Serine phosphatase RsbU, regulator of sigma subunit, partial [uncultured Frankineae bacterium]